MDDRSGVRMLERMRLMGVKDAQAKRPHDLGVLASWNPAVVAAYLAGYNSV